MILKANVIVCFQEPTSGGTSADEPAIMEPAEDVQVMRDTGGKKEQSPDELKAEIQMVNFMSKSDFWFIIVNLSIYGLILNTEYFCKCVQISHFLLCVCSTVYSRWVGTRFTIMSDWFALMTIKCQDELMSCLMTWQTINQCFLSVYAYSLCILPFRMNTSYPWMICSHGFKQILRRYSINMQ